MIKRLKIKGLKNSDRVYSCGGEFVKVRLLKKEVLSQNKLNGPQAISFTISTALCDKFGKAIEENGGKFAILPHTLTIPFMEAGNTQTRIKKGLDDAIKPLIEKTVSWSKSRKAAEKVLADWEAS